MKKLRLSLIVAIVLLATGGPALGAVSEGIAAIVNDSVITMTDIKDRTLLYLSDSAKNAPPEQVKKMEQQVLNLLIDETLQLQEAKKLGISVSAEEVNAGFADISRQNGLAPDEFKKRLARTGVSINSLYSQIRANVAWAQVVRRKLRPQVNISESEIDLTLEQIAMGAGKKQYQVAEIFLNVPEPAKEADLREAAEKLVKQLAAGAPFAEVARKFSQAPGAAGGGDLGWLQEGQLDPELDGVLEKMQPGQISPPVRSAKGYHILFLRDTRHSAGQKAAAAVADQTISMKQIFIPLTPKDSQAVIAAKTARGKSLKKEIRSCKAMNARMKDFPSPDTGDLGKGPLSGLPVELQATVKKLKIGELSAPIRNPSGIVLLMVCSREEASPATAEQSGTLLPAATGSEGDEPSRDKIASQIGMRRLNLMALGYLRDLRATAFIDKRI